ncbi:hypothetical protein A2631_04035 [Candidatus Daviesbacteria bacterium RIFCSPHIGHO2_01_FULL_44_29]|uniref:Reactive intermediate/imine deaminase n=1 Tax=Candidatus Daviesbacteria bacterium RIFCSPHIGHO2_02_FULL_43_12 TaxID=1797776 RepID=A0A1F5KGB9_9BACT|nr:MAG: hypothetical protein A2631_04035 [Candidatus Daviesbacteria bacterium RIFCSPHIGHO2_01_FULL_44_29]OGE39899.1 MAG: hypothetical protein A3D25_03765 [Candidatus Daviesbacteria bacterium RIFCSPHIGHO2_02_FULL_43_12]OGE40696.1 MAG: hypothetical protein A3E86_04315 [Candidatus Daviesbacteria bacterium RIFCSPHIGHO2_12_FULL_47_45]OGE70420.1 MAG: hypothetical protein A3B55_01805 [Candidatus Daviesbacteria bacterium RIFCSPLOWO2_01_FULL_43_15]
MKFINSSKAPAVVGPYSHAIVSNGMVYLSGSIGVDPQTGDLAEGIENQTKQVLANLKAVLKDAGSSVDKIVSANCYLQSMEDYAKFNHVYGEFFGNHKPARTTIEVAALPRKALVEISFIAEI